LRSPSPSSFALATLVFEQELATQQCTRIVRHAPQQLLVGLLLLGLRALLGRRRRHPLRVAVLLRLLQGLLHLPLLGFVGGLLLCGLLRRRRR